MPSRLPTREIEIDGVTVHLLPSGDYVCHYHGERVKTAVQNERARILEDLERLLVKTGAFAELASAVGVPLAEREKKELIHEMERLTECLQSI